MGVTAIVTNHNYARFLRQCLDTATHFCDEVLVYDDGSTDESLEVVKSYGLKPVHRTKASGSPVWGSNRGIRDATESHILFLDADNYLLRKPPQTEFDYLFADILIVNEQGIPIDTWEYPYWPLTASACLERFRRTAQIPVPWGGVWKREFLHGLKWRHWDTTQFAADFRTCVEWLHCDPTIGYERQTMLAFRQHGAQWSASPERVLMEAEARELAKGEL